MLTTAAQSGQTTLKATLETPIALLRRRRSVNTEVEETGSGHTGDITGRLSGVVKPKFRLMEDRTDSVPQQKAVDSEPTSSKKRKRDESKRERDRRRQKTRVNIGTEFT